MANYDHADNIGTHPAYSQDPETRLRARLDAARRNRIRAEAIEQTARQNLLRFTEEHLHTDTERKTA